MPKTARAVSDFHTLRVINSAEPLSMLYFLHLKSNWPKTLIGFSLFFALEVKLANDTVFSLNKKNNKKQT